MYNPQLRTIRRITRLWGKFSLRVVMFINPAMKQQKADAIPYRVVYKSGGIGARLLGRLDP